MIDLLSCQNVQTEHIDHSDRIQIHPEPTRCPVHTDAFWGCDAFFTKSASRISDYIFTQTCFYIDRLTRSVGNFFENLAAQEDMITLGRWNIVIISYISAVQGLPDTRLSKYKMISLLFLSAISAPFTMAQSLSSECEGHRTSCAQSLGSSPFEQCLPGFVDGQLPPPPDKFTDDVKKCICLVNSDLFKW